MPAKKSTPRKTTAKTAAPKFKPLTVKTDKAHPHGFAYELWDTVPSFPHHPGEHGTPTDDSVPGELESQCGATFDTQNVESYDGTLGVTKAFVDSHERPVGQLQWNSNLAAIYSNPGTVNGVRWCSGTLISCDMFLSAGHCFDKTGGGWIRPKDNTTGNTIEPAEIATNMHVNFNYQRDPSGVMRVADEYPVLELVEYRLGGLDFAVARLGGNPGNKYGWTPVATSDAIVGDMLAIIGHPNGVPKVVEAGPLTDLHGNSLGYNSIDTLGGSSGSGVLGPAGTIVGVHTNGGCTTSNIGHNHGVRISSILAASTTVSSIAANPGKFANDGCNILKYKFKDDQPPYKKSYWDGPRKPIYKDVNPKSLVDKRIGDVKMSAYDWNVRDPRFGIDPVAARVNPALRGGGAGPQPFVLSTGHHSEAMAEHEHEEPDIIEAMAEQVEMLHAQLMVLGEALEQFMEGQS
ncbi:MAG: trypsin-like peptidase domain-containing protein [Actinomycetota bacterium]